MRQKVTELLIISLVILGLLVVLLNLTSQARESYVPPTPTVTPTKLPREKAKVVKVIDGDTIEIEHKVKVRYIGIDTPEIVDSKKPVQCFGKEAARENEKLVGGQEIEMEKDVNNTDKYGRLLRYVYIEGKMINLELVSFGFAKTETIPPDVKYADQIKAAEENARLQNLGLWKQCQS